MVVLPCLASSVFLQSPRHLAPSHHSRGSFLSTLVITWCHSKVTSASFSYPQNSPRVHGHKHSVMRAKTRWLHSSVTSCSQHRWSPGPITSCLLEAMSPASPLLSSGMPSHFTASSRYLFL